MKFGVGWSVQVTTLNIIIILVLPQFRNSDITPSIRNAINPGSAGQVEWIFSSGGLLNFYYHTSDQSLRLVLPLHPFTCFFFI